MTAPFTSSSEPCPVCGHKQWADTHPVHMLGLEDRVSRYGVIRCGVCDTRFIAGQTVQKLAQLQEDLP